MNIGIIGGGISGMILASKLNKHKVTILESNNRLGKKLLLTGNGKCNYTNMNFDNLDYIYNCELAKRLYKKYDNTSFISYLYKLGVVPKIEVHKNIKYVYPNSNKATSVYYALYDKILSNNIKIKCDELVSTVYKENDKFIVNAKSKYIFDKLVFATGGITYTKNECASTALSCIKSLGHRIVELSPGLTPINYSIKDVNLNKFDFNGFRIDAEVSFIDGEKIYSEYGEIQFTKLNLSGIPVLNMSNIISRPLNIDNKNIDLHLDFSNAIVDNILYNKDANNKEALYKIKSINSYKEDKNNRFSVVYDILMNRKNELCYKKVEDFLCGYLPDELNQIIFTILKLKAKKVYDLSSNDITELTKLIIDFKVHIDKNLKYDNAQITIGGVDTNEVNSETLESKIVDGLYIIGEALDINGICGGYNIQMAYSSAAAVAETLLKMEE